MPNPYQQVITIVCRTLAAFDDDRIIPSYGFGDAQSRSQGLFSFLPNEQPVHEFPNILAAYNDIARSVTLSGGTSFAPAINKAVEIVINNKMSFHICVIIADGQVRARRYPRDQRCSACRGWTSRANPCGRQ